MAWSMTQMMELCMGDEMHRKLNNKGSHDHLKLEI